MSCATGESVLKDDTKIQSDLVDMEAYVYAKFSQKFNIDFRNHSKNKISSDNFIHSKTNHKKTQSSIS